MAELFGRYRLDDRLGQGGMGIVYRAWDTVLERVVALKMVLSDEEGALEPEVRERFLREARAAAHLTHRNIVTIYDLGEHEGRPYFAMEFLEGEDLQRRLSRQEKTSVWRKIDIAIEMCQGMEFAHAHGVIHRDLKPANIYITSTGGVKVLDFGLARLLSSQMTRSNMLMGTLNYLSPEQVRGERADQQSDIFSIGVVLYELFGGRRAFQGDSAAATLYKILQEVPDPLWKLDPELPRELTTIVDRALAKPRDERYPDMASLRHDLESVRAISYPPGPMSPWPAKTPPPYGDVTQPVLRTPTPVSAPVATPAPAPTLTPSPTPSPTLTPSPTPVPVGTGQGSTARGFWAGATVGALALALVVLWMVTQRGRSSPPPVVPKPAENTVPTRGLPAPTLSASSTTQPPPVAEAEPARTAAGAPTSDKPSAANKTLPSDKTTGRKREGSSPVAGVKAQARATQPRPAQPVETKPLEPAPAAPPPAPVTQTAPPPVPPSVPVTAATPSMPAVGISQPAAPPAAAAEPPALSAERANELLNRYKAALESKNLEQLKRIWPSMSASAESAMRQEFEHAARIGVEISSPQVSASGPTGHITFVRNYSLVTVEGQRLQNTTRAVMDVHRAGDAWLIDAIRFVSR
jgi:serine/threonine-protein kinase